MSGCKIVNHSLIGPAILFQGTVDTSAVLNECLFHENNNIAYAAAGMVTL